jgi:hypothetical protein
MPQALFLLFLCIECRQLLLDIVELAAQRIAMGLQCFLTGWDSSTVSTTTEKSAQ